MENNQRITSHTFGGQASPNPSYPQTVHVVKGTNVVTIANNDNTQSQTYAITLPTGMELCKIGNYQDYIYKNGDNWYKHKAIEKATWNGTEDWKKGSGTTNLFYLTLTDRLADTGAIQNIYCDKHFWKANYGNVSNADAGMTNGQIACNNNGTSQNVFIKNTSVSSADDFKYVLTTELPTAYYLLATPVEELITDTTLINQLDNFFENSYSYDEVTYLTSEGNLGLNLKIKALIKNS